MKKTIKNLALITIGVVIGRVIERNTFKDYSQTIPYLSSDF